MPYTQYVGKSGSRKISVQDWANRGITAAQTTWNPANNFSVDEATLTAPQIALLAANSDFLTGQATTKNAVSAAAALSSVTTPTAGTIVSATSALAVNCEQYPTVAFYLSGTFTGVSVIFEQSPDSTDGVNGTWYATTAAQINANAYIQSAVALTNSTAVAYEISAPAAKMVRMRATAWTSGTVNVQATRSPQATELAPIVQTHPVTVSSGALNATYNGSATSATIAKVLSAASTNATLLKAAGARVYGIVLTNTTAAAKYFRFYNKATAPVPGTDSPVFVVALPPNDSVHIEFSSSMPTAAGLGYAITGAFADLDATAVAAGDVVGFVTYV